MGHAAAYSPLAKHKYEETSARSLGPVYRYRNYTSQIVVVNDPALQQEVHRHSCAASSWYLQSLSRHHSSACAGATVATQALAELLASSASDLTEHDADAACLADSL